MYFAVAKLTFESGAAQATDRRELHSLVEKLRSRFKVCAAAIEDDGAGSPAIALTALGSSQERLSQTLDAITDFCEGAGFGRLESEETLLDHIDAVADIGSEDEAED